VRPARRPSRNPLSRAARKPAARLACSLSIPVQAIRAEPGTLPIPAWVGRVAAVGKRNDDEVHRQLGSRS